MTVSRLLKHSFTSILITLLMTLQISACNTRGSAETTGDNIVSSNSDTPGTPILAEVNLSWTAPSEREDNEPISLSEIAGYKVYYGTIQNDYPNSVDINDGSAEGYTFKGFSTGTYYFVLTTYDTEGRESQYSPAVKIVV